MKKPDDYRQWTNLEIEEDSAGFLAAQQATREREEREASERREAEAKRRFEEAFVKAGGYQANVEEAWRSHKNQRAQQEAERLDLEASSRTLREAWNAL